MSIIQYLKRRSKSADMLLLILFFGNIWLIGNTIYESLNRDFSITVTEGQLKLPVIKRTEYLLQHRTVQGELTFKSDKIVDFIFVRRTENPIVPFMFSAIMIWILIQIKSLWHDQYFTKKLYLYIDALGIIAIMMFLFASVQGIYLKHLVNRMSDGVLVANNDNYLLLLAAIFIILSPILKSFAKQGKIIQEEQDLTI